MAKILILGVISVMAVMLFTAIITLIAPYIAVIIVLLVICAFVVSRDDPEGKGQ